MFAPKRVVFSALVVSVLIGVAVESRAAANAPVFLWQIGKPDNDFREFALAPNRYGEFRDDGFFAVGRSDPARDWPYVHPGPVDGWAGGRPHKFSVLFGLKAAPAKGECGLHLDLVDAHAQAPPELAIEVNGRLFRVAVARGAGDASVFGDPSQGKEQRFTVAFGAEQLRAGVNEIALTSRSGSWVLYDWLALEGPAGLELTEVKGTVLAALRSPPVLIERGGKLMQSVQATVRHLGGEAAGALRVNGAVATNFSLGAAGVMNVEAPVPAVEQPGPVSVALEVGGQVVATQTLTLKPVRKWGVYLLAHSHVDIGYTHVQTDVERAQWRYLELAMDTARRTAAYPPGCRFKWNTEVLWAVDGYLRQAPPEKQRAFFEAVKQGWVGLDALYGNMLTGLCRPEELLRTLRLATQLAQRSGVPIESAMITDVPGYTWGLVPAFAHSGVKYFSIGPNGGDRIGHTIAAWGDKPFWWLGPNPQERVLVWMTGTGYYQVFQSAERLLEYLGRLEEKAYPYDMVQVRHCLGDNGAPDVNFADKVKAWNDAYAYPRLVIATTAEMFRDFEQRYGGRLPTARGDFTPYWEDGAASSARETALNRATADRLTQAEALYALFNPKAYPAEAFARAWRNVILYDEHTWGAHNSISEPDAPFVKSQWAIKQAFALEGNLQSRKLLEAADVSRGPSSARVGNVQAIDVVNTTSAGYPWTLVTVPKELSQPGDGVGSAPDDPHTLVAQRLSSGELVFRPCWGPYSARRYYITDGRPAPLPSFPAARAEGATLSVSNSALARSLTLRVDAQSGAIASLRYAGRELVNTSAPTALNDYFYLPGSDLKGVQRSGPAKITVKERGPLIASLVVESEAPGCRKLTREIRLHALRNYVEIINTVDKTPVRAKEGVHFGFAFQVPNGTVRMDVPWAVVRPEIDQIPGACKNWFTVQRWVDISNSDGGVAWLTPDAPLVELGALTANLIGSLSDPRAWLEHVDPSPTIYSWAMNNHWHTNYRAEQEGPTVFRYFLFPHGPFVQDEVARWALECSQPLLVLPARGQAPGEPALHVAGDGLLVNTLKPSDDGQAWIVRLFSASGKDQQARLTWRQPGPSSLWLSDLGERPIRQIPGAVNVPAGTIVTLRANLAE